MGAVRCEIANRISERFNMSLTPAVQITVFTGKDAADAEIERKCDLVKNLLKAHNIPYEKLSTSAHRANKGKMHEPTKDPDCKPPQIFNGSQYCGDYTGMTAAAETGGAGIK